MSPLWLSRRSSNVTTYDPMVRVLKLPTLTRVSGAEQRVTTYDPMVRVLKLLTCSVDPNLDSRYNLRPDGEGTETWARARSKRDRALRCYNLRPDGEGTETLQDTEL